MSGCEQGRKRGVFNECLHGVSALLHRKSWLVVHGMVWGKWVCFAYSASRGRGGFFYMISV